LGKVTSWNTLIIRVRPTNHGTRICDSGFQREQYPMEFQTSGTVEGRRIFQLKTNNR
jgi:hypothetical protein